MRVLFTGGGGAGTASLWQQLSAEYDVHFADAQPERIHPIVPAGNRHGVPMANADGFLPSLRQLVRGLDIDLLVPGVDEELLVIANARRDLLPCRVLLPDSTDIQRCLDKLEFARSAKRAGLRVPGTSRLDESAGWDSFPCIAKPRSGRGSAGVMIIRDAAALHGWAEVVPEPADVIVQELVQGPEFTVQVVADASAQLRAIVPVRVHSKRGITISATTDADHAVIEACRAMHATFPTAGVVNVQGILDESDRFWPFEVNPRVSTTLCLVIASGVDPLAMFDGRAKFDGQAQSDARVSAEGELAGFTSSLAMERFWDTRIGDRPPTREGIEHG